MGIVLFVKFYQTKNKNDEYRWTNLRNLANLLIIWHSKTLWDLKLLGLNHFEMKLYQLVLKVINCKTIYWVSNQKNDLCSNHLSFYLKNVQKSRNHKSRNKNEKLFKLLEFSKIFISILKLNEVIISIRKFFFHLN